MAKNKYTTPWYEKDPLEGLKKSGEVYGPTKPTDAQKQWQKVTTPAKGVTTAKPVKTETKAKAEAKEVEEIASHYDFHYENGKLVGVTDKGKDTFTSPLDKNSSYQKTKTRDRIDEIRDNNTRKRLEAMEKAKKEREEATRSKKYGAEWDYIKKIKDGSASEVDKVSYNYYKRIRERAANNTKYYLDGDIKELYEEYEKIMSDGWGDDKSLKACLEEAENVRNKIDDCLEYYELYGGDEKEVKRLKNLRNEVYLNIQYDAEKRKEMLKSFESKEDYDAFVFASSMPDYATMKKTREAYEQQLGYGYDDEVQTKIDALDKYGLTEQVMKTMSGEDWDYEKARAEKNFAKSQGKHDYYNSPEYFEKHYRSATLGSGMSEDEAREDLQSKIKAQSQEAELMRQRYDSVSEMAMQNKALAEMQNKWGVQVGNLPKGANTKADKNKLSQIEAKSGNGHIDNAEAMYYAVNKKGRMLRGDNGLPVAVASVSAEKLNLMTKEEIDYFNWLYNEKGSDEALEYIEAINPLLNKRYTIQRQKESYEYGKEHPWASWAFNTLEDAAQAAASPFINVETIIKNTIGEIDPYSPEYIGQNVHGYRLQGGTDKLGKWYGAANAITSNLATMLMARGMSASAGKAAAGVVSGLLNSSKGMSDRIIQGMQNGEDGTTAICMGLISGFIEYATEKWSMDLILKEPDLLTNKNLVRKIVNRTWKVGRDFVVEGGEEVTSSLLNALTSIIADSRKNDDFLIAFDNAKAEGKTDGEALGEAVKAVKPQYIEEFLVGGIAGGLFGGVNAVSTIRQVQNVRDAADVYLAENGISRGGVTKFLIENGVTDDATLARVSNGIVKMGNGEQVTEAVKTEINENPFYRGVLYGYVDASESLREYEAKKAVPVAESESAEPVENKRTVENISTSVGESAKSVGDIEKSDNSVIKSEMQINELKRNMTDTAQESNNAEDREKALRALSDSNPEQTQRTIGRTGSKTYLEATTEGDGGLVDSLISDGYSPDEALRKTEQLFVYLYEQGRKGTDKDIAMQASSQYILKGHEADALLFYNSGKNDADGRLIGKTNARLVTNNTLRQMRKDGDINYRTERGLNALASKLGVDIEFNSTMSDGKLGSFNAKTGKLMINSKAKNKYFVTAVHESIHAMRSIDSESYNKLVDIVDNVLSKNDVVYDKAWNTVLTSYKKQATKDGKFDRDYIDEELTAKVVSHLLADEKFIKEIAKSDRSFVRRAYDAIVDLFQKIFKRYSENTTAREKDVQAAIDELKSEFNTIKTMYENALESTKDFRQSEMKLPKSGDEMHSKNSLTANSEDDNIDSSKGVEQNGEKDVNDGRGTGGISENVGNKGRGNTGNKRDVSFGQTETLHQNTYSKQLETGNRDKRSGLAHVEHWVASSKGLGKPSGDRQAAENRRFQQAIDNNDVVAANDMLNKKATKSGYIPSKVYHGTKAEIAFVKFKGEKPIWITADIDYASEYTDLDYAENSPLYTETDSKVYELYAKFGKILDVGDIGKELLTYDDVVNFGKKIGFTASEIFACRAQGRAYGSDEIWTITQTPKFAEIARQKGYDSLRALEYGGTIETYGILYPQNLKSSKLVTYDSNGDIIPLSERFNPENEDIRYNLENGEEVIIEAPIKRHKRRTAEQSLQSFYELQAEVQKKLDDHIKKYGAMEKGANAARDVTIPKKTSDGDRKVRRFTRTAIESDTISDDEAVKLMEEIADGKMWTTYQIAGDKKTTAVAYKTLETRGFDSMLNEWDALLESGKKLDKQDIVNAQILVQEASKKGDRKTVVRLIGEIASELTDAGQLVQAASLMKKLGAAANVYSIERAIDRAQRDIIKKYGAKAPKIQKPTELIEKYSEALERENKSGNKDHTESDKYADMIYENIGKQIPVTFMDKVDALRYFCMLANPKTHIKNILSNTVFWPLVFAKNILASSIEGGTATVMKLFGKDFQRTKSVRGMFAKGEIREYAKNDALKMRKVYEQGEGKYNEHMSRFDEHRLVFNKSFVSKGIEKMRGKEFDGILNMITRKNSDLLGIEDWWFGESHYTRALTSYMMANKLTPRTITSEQLDVARIYALKEAKRATFRDKSELAKILRKFSRANPVMTFIVESQVPFKGTPINLLKRSFEYSPAGIITAMAKGLYKVRHGEFTASEFISELSEGLTGSILFVVGYFLLCEGILHGVGDDEEENKLAELNGVQNYSLKLGGQTYTIDWAIPAASALFAGAEMAKIVKDDEVSFADVSAALGRLTHPLIETSMLDGLTNTLKSVTYGENAFEMVENFVASFVTNYLGQFTPSFLGAIARTIDPVRRKTYVDKNSDWPQWIQIYYQQQAKKIPGLSMKLQPLVNAKGETELNVEGNIFARFMQNTLSPGYYKKIRSSAVDEEMARLYDVLGEDADGILPKSVEKKIGKINLSAEQYTTYQQTTGKAYYKVLKDIIGSDYYNTLSDEQKVDLLEKAREYSVEVGKDAALDSYKITNGWLKTAFETEGAFQYVLDLDKTESFGIDDLGESFDQYEADREKIFNDILGSYKPDGSDFEFADKFYESLYEFTNRVALENNSGGAYTIDTAWINNIKGMTAKEQAEYIYGKTLISDIKDQDEANAKLKGDEFISDKVRMWLLQKSTGGNSSPGVMYNKYLAKYKVDEVMWGSVWELKEELNDRAAAGEDIDTKKLILSHINKQQASDEQKSAIYRGLGYGESEKALKGVPWRYVAENADEKPKNGELESKVGTNIAKVSTYNNNAKWGQCVWFARGRAKEKLGAYIPPLGDANQMYGSAKPEARLEAKAENLKGDTLLCFREGTSPIGKRAGHVIYIEDVVGDTVYYTEGGYGTDSGILKTTTINDVLNGNGGKIGSGVIGLIDVTKY